jgi:hypothetical protein
MLYAKGRKPFEINQNGGLNMEIRFNVTGAQRKSLVGVISSALNTPTKYLGMPSAAYEVGDYTITKDGTLTFSDRQDSEEVENLLEALAANGFVGEAPAGASGVEFHTYQAELSDPDCPDRMEVFSAEDDADAVKQAREFCEGEIVLLELRKLDDDYNEIGGVDLNEYPTGLCIEVPLAGFTPEKLDNLEKMVAAKAALIKAALGTTVLPIKQTAETLQFPWFTFSDDEGTTLVYSQFIAALCKTAKTKKRVTAKEQGDCENPKYALRCFLLSIGMIGAEYSAARKLLLKNLSGNSSFKTPESAEKWNAVHGKKAEVKIDG